MFVLPDLPYAYDALQPVVSDRTLQFHHDKHHATYVKTLNDLLAAAGKSPASLEAVIIEAAKGGEKKVFNNAAQAWNHAFFWDAMASKPAAASGALADAIKGAFGDLAGLKTAFVTEGIGHFGSGWVWLTADKSGALKIISTHDAECTLTLDGVTPLLVCDLWEHAYYLDHQNNRKGFLEAWFDSLANWSLADTQLAAAQGKGEVWRYPAPTK